MFYYIPEVETLEITVHPLASKTREPLTRHGPIVLEIQLCHSDSWFWGRCAVIWKPSGPEGRRGSQIVPESQTPTRTQALTTDQNRCPLQLLSTCSPTPDSRGEREGALGSSQSLHSLQPGLPTSGPLIPFPDVADVLLRQGLTLPATVRLCQTPP